MMAAEPDIVLELRGLVTSFGPPDNATTVVDHVDLTIHAGEVVCLVGESGSGKSVTAFSIMRLIDEPGRVQAEAMQFTGIDLLAASESDMDRIRGRGMALVFQEPMTALNPARTVGNQIAEILRTHEKLPRREAWARAVSLMGRVGIHEPDRRARAYPHELSGGMRQRVMIAIACALSPALIIADEPTTALDVTVQAQVLELLFEMQAQTGSAVLFITHDLGVVAEIADRVAVMQNGRIVEEADVASLFADPKHPYTRALLAAVPDIDSPRDPARRLSSPKDSGTVQTL
jgi:ABC-type dipeptide/oligopeptide/nickel transport system ATPase component